MRDGSLVLPDGAAIVPRVRRTGWFWERMRGLLGTNPLADGEGLLITPCAAVHTVGMRYPLDLVFLDAQGRVVRTVANVPPGRLAVSGGVHARATLEVRAGWLDLLALEGRELRWMEEPRR